jgi:hypothetical protein
VAWTVRFTLEFAAEFSRLPSAVQIELLAQASVIEQFGPHAGRPRVDRLKGSKFANMKELRFDAAGGVGRVAFAFDVGREAILLAAGDKSDVAMKQFYRQLLAKADRRFTLHLSQYH